MESPAKFVQEVRQEVGKVTWPTMKETRTSTIMVMLMVLVSAVFFWLADSIISWIVGLILGFRG
jgi:preprotein translocase subunit SecE